MKTPEETLRDVIKAGSAQRKCLFALAFFLLGLMFVALGFWRTVFVALLTALGAFLGSTDKPMDSIKKLINKIVPPSNKAVTYSTEEIERVKRALDMKDSAREAAAAGSGDEPSPANAEPNKRI